jgi:hypothetical protein
MFKVSNLGLKIALGASLYAAGGVMLPTANANLIDDAYGIGAGSFELGQFTPIGINELSFMVLAPGSTTITGWTVGGSGEGVDWATDFYGPDTGDYAVDLRHLTGGSSTTSTVIDTTVNSLYELSFSTASVLGYSNTGVFSAGSLVNQAFTATFSPANTFSTQLFTPLTFQFTATGPSPQSYFKAPELLCMGR